MATIRQRKRGVWEVRVFVGRDEHGRPVQVSRTVRGGKKDAERVAADLDAKPARQAGRRTVADLLGAWQELKAPSWAPYTRRDQASRSRAVAGRLGHADASTTLRVYSHALVDRDSALADSLSDALGGGGT